MLVFVSPALCLLLKILSLTEWKLVGGCSRDHKQGYKTLSQKQWNSVPIETLELKDTVCVFDHAHYAKAAEITWKHKKFKNIILRMENSIPFATFYQPPGRGFRILACVSTTIRSDHRPSTIRWIWDFSKSSVYYSSKNVWIFHAINWQETEDISQRCAPHPLQNSAHQL